MTRSSYLIDRSTTLRLVVVIAATVGVVAYSMTSRSTSESPPQPNDPAPAASPMTAPTPSSAIAAPAEPALPAGMDIRGHLGREGARCAGTATAAAIGRTNRSLVVICTSTNRGYEYRGVRLSDGAALQLAGVTVTEGGFLARNEDIAYAVSPTELVVSSGDAVLGRDPMVEYWAPERDPVSVPAAVRRGLPDTHPDDEHVCRTATCVWIPAA